MKTCRYHHRTCERLTRSWVQELHSHRTQHLSMHSQFSRHKHVLLEIWSIVTLLKHEKKCKKWSVSSSCTTLIQSLSSISVHPHRHKYNFFSVLLWLSKWTTLVYSFPYTHTHLKNLTVSSMMMAYISVCKKWVQKANNNNKTTTTNFSSFTFTFYARELITGSRFANAYLCVCTVNVC